MNTTWTTGKHQYIGKYNDRSKRQKSKILKGIKLDYKKLSLAFKLIEKEKCQKS